MRLFIDTNIFLSFFHYSSESLEELHKLGALMRTKEVTLYLPGQVKGKLSAIVHDFSRKSCTIAESLQSTSSEDRVPCLFATEPGVRQ
jgi:hypothetical protein